VKNGGWRPLARRIADGLDVDWRSLERQTASASARTVLRVLEDAVRPADARAQDAARLPHTWIERVATLLAAIALLQVALALGPLTERPSTPSIAPTSHGLRLATLAIHACGGIVLFLAGARNRSARALGGVYLGVAAAFASGVAVPAAWLPDGVAGVVAGIMHFPADLALAAGAWYFILTFPPLEPGAALQRVTRVAAAVVAVVIAGLAAANVAIQLVDADSGLYSALNVVSRRNMHSRYWSIYFLSIAASVPLALARLRYGYVAARAQVRRFLLALTTGFAPLTILSIAGASSRAGFTLVTNPAVVPAETIAVFAGLWALPVTTGTALLSTRILPTRSLVRRSLQYALARWTLAAAIVVPIVGAARVALENRHRTIDAFLAGGGSIWLSLAVGSIALAIARPHLLQFIDWVFQRHRADPRALVASLASSIRRQTNAQRIAELLLESIEAACHPKNAAVLVRAAGSGVLAAIAGDAAPIPLDSAIGGLLAASPTSLVVDSTSDDAVVDLLPAAERAALAAWAVLVPIYAEGDALVGAACVGPPRAADAYTPDDIATIETLAASAGHALGQRLGVAGGADAATSVPGQECERCGRIAAHVDVACACGGALAGSSLPPRLGGFTLLRRLGRGGMGVVYEARDEALQRSVALKALPEVGPDEIARVQNEARLMATLQHPGIAVVFGLETFRSMPVLVVEMLAGGTLQDRLRTGALPAAEVAALARPLADALDYLHAAGILHRDLKPSNVGFTASGQPKVFDLGVAVKADADRVAGGTLLYLSPDAVADDRPDRMADLWAFAVLLCEAWVGGHPLAGLPIDEQLAHLKRGTLWAHASQRCPDDARLKAVFARALDPDASRRFRTAAEFARALAVETPP